ncbi:TetR/AcrR family transcriptional regulator [Gynuella sunshinyii]|uniref:Transcriptional regulator n=1 Tax=Gynuella sunshinyii YC6258 TaxID=1445510 RepID=A0A0C5VIX8_9GAMM|nr:TetR/AcrR family transcriptional regulator [Gynuella sunshinyii]AJQ94211.1 transcriptional regulator [Gynuella sunshinyii YC6258]
MERNSSIQKNIDKKRRKASGAAVFQESVTLALQRALFEEWAEVGYSSLKMERIASRAGVGKAALYRRWKSKKELVYDAMPSIAVTITEIPDTGSFEEDVRIFVHSLAVALRHPLVRRILPDMHAERVRSGELEDLITLVTKKRRDQATVILERAIARGDLLETIDVPIALDFFIANIYWSMIIQRRRLSKEAIDKISRAITISIRQAL